MLGLGLHRHISTLLLQSLLAQVCREGTLQGWGGVAETQEEGGRAEELAAAYGFLAPVAAFCTAPSFMEI